MAVQRLCALPFGGPVHWSYCQKQHIRRVFFNPPCPPKGFLGARAPGVAKGFFLRLGASWPGVFGWAFTVGCLCMRYCVDFQSPSSDWISYSGSYDSMADSSFACSRGWVVIQSSDFAGLDPSLATASTTFTPDQVAALKYLADNPSPFSLDIASASLIATAILGVWGIAYCWRSIANFFSGGDSSE